MDRRVFSPGDPAPRFVAASTSNPRFHFDTIAGRYVVLCFLGTAAHPSAAAALRTVNENHALLDDDTMAFFGVSIDPADQREQRLQARIPGIRFFWDFDLAVSRLYGAANSPTNDPAADARVEYRPFWLVLDPLLRVLYMAPLDEGEAVFRYLRNLPPVALHAGSESTAPVLLLPRVFEPELCRSLIALYHAVGGVDSGFMEEENGKTVGRHNLERKSRKDCVVEDETLRTATRLRIERRLLPEIARTFQYRVTRMERYIVACYDAETRGRFRAHRDNTTTGTAHRRFAVTINLNSEDYEGGDLRFPEFGPRTYRAPTGGAVVFSCSLLHEALPVNRGKRYAFLPFLYDEAAAEIRAANAKFLVGEEANETP